MIEFLLKSKPKKASIYKDVLDNPEKYILTMSVEEKDEIVIRVRKKEKSIARKTSSIMET